MKNNSVLHALEDFIFMTVGSMIISCAVYFFLMPSHLTIASVSGLSLLLAEFLPLSMSTINLIINIICLVLGFTLIGKEFGGKTVYTSLLIPIGLIVLERVYPNYTSVLGNPFEDMVCYVFVVNFGCAILFGRNASSGGLDVIAKILNKYFHIDLGRAMTLSGMSVALSSIFAYDAKTVILSVLGTYVNGMVLDHFIFGNNVKKKVCIISDRIDDIKDYVINNLKSGASICELIGAYTMKKRTEIDIIVDKSEYGKLMTYIKHNVPDAFVTVTLINEVQYRPKWIEK